MQLTCRGHEMPVDMCRHVVTPYNASAPKPEHQHLPHPTTPDIYQICSKRSFDGQVTSSFPSPSHCSDYVEL